MYRKTLGDQSNSANDPSSLRMYTVCYSQLYRGRGISSGVRPDDRTEIARRRKRENTDKRKGKSDREETRRGKLIRHIKPGTEY